MLLGSVFAWLYFLLEPFILFFTQIVDSLRCVSNGAEHSGVNFPGFAALTKALLNRTSLPALGTVKLLAKFLGCTGVVSVHLLPTLVGCSTRILPLVVLEVAKFLVVYKRFSRPDAKESN